MNWGYKNRLEHGAVFSAAHAPLTCSADSLKMNMSMMMMVVVVIGVSLMVGSDALTCYMCENWLTGVNLEKRPIYKAGEKCFDPRLLTEDDTCEAKKYCSTHWYIKSPESTYTIHSFTFSSSSECNSGGSSSSHLGDL